MFVYADNAATTCVSKTALDAMMPYLTEQYGNPSSLYAFAQNAKEALENARKTVADIIGAQPKEIYFTSGGSEADNQAIVSMAKVGALKGKKHLISTKFEHHAVLHTLKKLEKEGFEVTLLDVHEDGVVRLEDLEAAVREDTALVTIMFANNEIGTVQPIKEIGEFCRARKIPFHTDAVQAAGHMPINVQEMNIDLLSMSGHKFHAPKGVGAMYIKKGIRVNPRMLGGGQEKGMRSGTESVPLISAFGAAVRAQLQTIPTAWSNAEELNNRLRKKLAALDYITINSNAEDQCPFILNFSVKGIRSEIMLHFLESKNIYVSSGSACSKGGHSSVLTAMGIPDKVADSAIRVSFSRMSSCGEVEALATALQEGYMSLAKR